MKKLLFLWYRKVYSGYHCENCTLRLLPKAIFLCIPLILVSALLFSCSSFVCFAADYKAIGDSIDKALKLKDAGDIDDAIASIQKALSTIDSIKRKPRGASESDEMYTKEYLQTLIECLKGNEVTYIAIIQYTSSLVQKARDAFLEVVDELKIGEISRKPAARIKEMKLEMSRAIVTHSFCVPPPAYKEVYNITQAALFWYSKAWGNLYQITLEKTAKKNELQAEALLSFQKGNELFSRAGTLMMAIPEKR